MKTRSNWIPMRKAHNKYSNSVAKPVSFDSFRRIVKKGAIDAKRDGVKWLVSVNSLNGFIKELKRPANGPVGIPISKNTEPETVIPSAGFGGYLPPATGSKLEREVRNRIWGFMAKIFVEKLRENGKQAEIYTQAINLIPDEEAKKAVKEYISHLEKIVSNIGLSSYTQAVQ